MGVPSTHTATIMGDSTPWVHKVNALDLLQRDRNINLSPRQTKDILASRPLATQTTHMPHQAINKGLLPRASPLQATPSNNSIRVSFRDRCMLRSSHLKRTLRQGLLKTNMHPTSKNC